MIVDRENIRETLAGLFKLFKKEKKVIEAEEVVETEEVLEETINP